jgi:Tfp pilus assembly protein PilX
MARLTVAVLFLITGVMLMLVLHLLVIAWAIRRGHALRRSTSSRDEEEHAEAAGLTADELGELPCQDFKAAAAGTPGRECAVCLEAFLAGDRCRVLPGCGHAFHALCVDSWLRKSRQCPVCRAEVAGCGKAASAVVDEAASSESAAEIQGGPDRL